MLYRLILTFLVPLLTILIPTLGAAEPAANRAFLETWERTDRPVAAGQVSRTWMWGPEAFTGPMMEPYSESPDGSRLVQYYDKSRMEISNPDRDPSSDWYVTNGLLVMELITGRLQLGDNQFEQHEPAEVNVAGDAGDANGPTYATLAAVLDAPPGGTGTIITQRIDRDGTVSDDPALAERDIRASNLITETNHLIADPFWEFVTSDGLVYSDGQYSEAALFNSPFFATGFPITEPYWTTVAVGGEPRDVLLQCFERRCLTYTPDNPDRWKVETGNVGRHYHEWRYGQLGFEPEPATYPSTGDVRVVGILYDPPVAEQEYVEIRNFDQTPIDLSGWQLVDEADNSYTFPDGYVLPLDVTLRVHLCGGEDTATDLYWDRCSAVWNNDGDTAYLYDAAGTLIHSWTY